MHENSLSNLNDAAERIFGRLSGAAVLVIGIGGGGDIIGAIPTYRALENLGAEPLLAGLTWKRKAHDLAARPRLIDEFENIERIDQFLGLVNGSTCLKDSGVRHVEADVAALFASQVLAIDISGGAGEVRKSLQAFMRHRGISALLAIDVGGDALCRGSEPTLRSPLCDQIMLKATSSFQNSILGVVGLGADGELPLTSFSSYFAELVNQGAYLASTAVSSADLEIMAKILQGGKSECSRCVLDTAVRLTNQQRLKMEEQLNCSSPDLLDVLQNFSTISLRDGSRRGELSALTAMTIYFKMAGVFSLGNFKDLISTCHNLSQIAQVLKAAGIITEFDQ